jgi:transposase InsO family protein
MIGRFKVSRLMDELGLICKQPGSHAYERATVERIDIPNVLNREFDVAGPNQVWCGDITYLWAQGRWHYLAVVTRQSAGEVGVDGGGHYRSPAETQFLCRQGNHASGGREEIPADARAN